MKGPNEIKLSTLNMARMMANNMKKEDNGDLQACIWRT